MNSAVVTIISCTPSLRKVEGQIKDGAPIPIVVWETPGLFVWPNIGEQWTVTRSIGVWKLGQRIEAAEGHSIEDLQPGEGKISADTIYDRYGRQLATTGDIPTVEGRHVVATDGDPPFENGYEHYQPGSVDFHPEGWEWVGFYRHQERAFLTGMTFSTEALSPGNTVFTLPEGYRPRARLIFFCYGDQGASRVDITPEGFVVNGSGSAISGTPSGSKYLALDNINFRVA